MTSRMWYMCVIVLQFLGIFAMVHADRSGTVVFMEAGSDVSFAEIFNNSVYNDHQNRTKYLWNFTELMTGPNFRSPLLDIGIDLNMTHFDVYAYNEAGEVMTSFPMTFENDAVSSAAGNLTLTDTGSLASMVLHADNYTELIRFLSINVKSTQPYGAQFILTTDDEFHDLPDIEMIGCYMFKRSELFSSLADTWTTQTADECTEYCVTKNGSNYALAFTSVINSMFFHRCTCVASLDSATNVSDSPLLCPDASDCGCSLFFESNPYVYASVYDMGQINSFLNNLTTYTYTTIMISTGTYVQNNYHNLGERYFISKVEFAGYPDVPYMLGLQVAEGCGPYSNFTYYGEGLGSPQVFNGNITQTLYPTPVRCLKVEILKSDPDAYTINFTIITDTFMTAKYLQVVGHWTNDECQPLEVLSNSTAVPDTWVNIKQMNKSSTSTSYWNDIPFPEMSTGVVNLTIPYETHRYYVVQRIKLTASVNTMVHTDVETDSLCVAIGTGNTTHQKYDMQFMSNVTGSSPHVIYIPNICARNIFFVMNATNPTGSLSSKVNWVKFVIQGCVIYDFDFYSPCNTTNITDMILATANVSWYWVPHPVRAVTYLRPGGPGLVLQRFEDPYIVIQLSEDSTPVEVERVSIRGDVISADISIGNVKTIIFNDSTTTLDYTPTQTVGHEVRIDNIIGRSDIPTNDTNYDFLIIHVEIAVCVVATSNGAPSTATPLSSFSNLTTVSSVTNSTTALQFFTFATKPTSAITTALPTSALGNSSVPSTSTTGPSLTIATSSASPTSSSTTSSNSPALNITSATSAHTPTTTTTGTATAPHYNPPYTTSVPNTISISSQQQNPPSTPGATSVPTSAATSASTFSTTTTGPNSIPSTTTTTPTTTSSTATTNPITTLLTSTIPITTSSTITTPSINSLATTSMPTTASSTTISTLNTTSSTITTTTTTNSSPPPTTTIHTSIAQPNSTHSTTTSTPTSMPLNTSATQTTAHTSSTSTTAAQPTTTTSSSTLLTSSTPAATTQTTSSSISYTTSTTSLTTTQLTTSVQTVTTVSSAGTTSSPPPSTPATCCICFSNTENMTQDEVEDLVQQLVRNLTVPKHSTSAFKRSLISAPDNRTSAKMVGTAGIAMMTLSGGLIVAMDYNYIVAVVQFCKHAIKGVFVP